MSNNFDPAQFVDMEISAPLERRPPLPVGDYTAVIGDVSCVPWQSKIDPSKSGLRYVVPLKLNVPPSVKADLHIDMDVIQLTDSIMLDLTEQGTMDLSVGKNNMLRRYREALDMNKPGDTFSARRMTGRLILVKVEHEVYQDQVMERVGSVAKA